MQSTPLDSPSIAGRITIIIQPPRHKAARAIAAPLGGGKSLVRQTGSAVGVVIVVDSQSRIATTGPGIVQTNSGARFSGEPLRVSGGTIGYPGGNAGRVL